jgi:hypothetical protein
MCDYSLMGVPNRLAVPGDDLVVHRFEAGVLGMVAPFDIEARREGSKKEAFWPKLKQFFKQEPDVPAVCIPPGSRLIVRDIPQELQRTCGLANHIGEAVFTQLTVEACAFRDAVRFNNGTEILLQSFAEGQRVRVLSVSSDEEETEPEYSGITVGTA